MPLLYLIRHATPVIQPGVPPRDWTLSERGVAEAQALASTAETWGVEAIYSSSEAKARATALIVGDALGLTPHVVDGFDELRMPDWIANSDEFNDLVRVVLEAQPEPYARAAPADVRRAETAAAAAERFAGGVRIVEQGPMPAAVVSHGRVLTAYLAQAVGLEDPYESWRAIPMPGWALVDLAPPRPRLVRSFTDVS